MIHDAAVFLSSWFTFATICMCILVVKHWNTLALKSIGELWRNKKELSPSQNLAIGVWFGFLCFGLDNTYWGVTWDSLRIMFKPEFTDWLFKHGFYFNIPFRQVGGCISVFFHVRAAVQYNEIGLQNLNKQIVFIFSLGFVYSLVLCFID